MALTSVLRPTLVNDLRLSVFAVSTRSGSAREEDCPRCLGLGQPSITIATDRPGDWQRHHDGQPGTPVSPRRLHHLAGDHASCARRSRLGVQPRPQSDLEQRAGDDDAVRAGPRAHAQLRRRAAGQNPAAAGVPDDRRHSSTAFAEHDRGHRRSRRAAGGWRGGPALEHVVALRRGRLAAARSGHADLRIGLGLRRRAQSRPQQAGPAGTAPRQRWPGTDATRMGQLRTGRRRDLDAVIGPENRPPRRCGPVLPAARIDVVHGRRTGCARPARPWPAARAGERHSQPIARNPWYLGRHAADLYLTHAVHRRRSHGGPSGDQGHSRPEPGRCRSDRAAD